MQVRNHYAWLVALAMIGTALAPAVVVSAVGWMLLIEDWMKP